MSENLPNLKKHTCPTCGGQLIVNEQRQMYECPFCGVSFDYEYFREDDVLSRAARALEAGEYQSAGEAYDFMLTKEPSNFTALRGKILASAVIKNTEELRQPDRLVRIPYVKTSESVDRAVADCLPEHKEYFSKMKELFETGKKYKEASVEVKRMRETQKQNINSEYALERRKSEYYVETNNKYTNETEYVHPKNVLIILTVLYVLWVVLWVAICGPFRKNPYSEAAGQAKSSSVQTTIATETLSSKEQEKKAQQESRSLALQERVRTTNEKQWKQKQEGKTDLMWMMILIPGAIFVIACADMLFKMSGIKEVDERMGKIHTKNEVSAEELSKCVKTCSALRAEINARFKELRVLDPMPMVPDAHNARPGSFLRGRWK